MATVEPSYRVYTHRHLCLTVHHVGYVPLYSIEYYTLGWWGKITRPVKRYLNFNLAQLANMEREGLRSYTATGHKGVIQMSRRRLQLVVLPTIDEKNNNKQHQEHCMFKIQIFFIYTCFKLCFKFYSESDFLSLRLNFSRRCSETNHHRRSRQGRQPLIQTEKLTSSWLWMKSTGCCELNVMPARRLLDDRETEGHESCSLRHNQSFRHPRLLLTDAKRRISAVDGQNTGHRLTTQRCVCVCEHPRSALLSLSSLVAQEPKFCSVAECPSVRCMTEVIFTVT